MPAILFFLKKTLPYLKYIIFLAAIIILLLLWWGKRNELSDAQKQLDLYRRQVAGQLTDKERQLEDVNIELGLSRSKLMDQNNLLKAYQEENIKVSADFEKFKKDYKIQLESYQKTIAQLQQQIKGGTTIVVEQPRTSTDPLPGSVNVIDPTKNKLSYTWESGDHRFKLDDPDIFVKNNESFTLTQSFRITGEIYREKVGFLKTQRLVVEEVILDGKNSDGTPKYKTIGTAKIIDSSFNYSEKSPDSWFPKKGVFGLWGVVSANFGLNNGLNPRFLLGTGLEFLQFKGLGLGLQLYLDANVWQDSGFGIDIAYRPTVSNTRLNLAIDLAIATQFRQPFQSYIPMLGMKFYLWD